MYRTRFRLSPAQARRVEALLDIGEIEGVLWVDRERPHAWLDAFSEDKEIAENSAALLDSVFRSDPEIGEAFVEVLSVPDRDWQDAWKEHFRAERVSERVIVAPGWETVEESKGIEVVRIDPGMSFGTGRHATTRACIRIIDRLAAERSGTSFCDVGCGSGILSIAAAKLGMLPVVAFDNDPVAVESAIRNAAVNGVADAVTVHHLDLASEAWDGVFDVVAANMLSNLLERFAPRIAALVAPGGPGRLILAGMMTDQVDSVIRVFARQGLEVLDTATEGDWASACLRVTTASRSSARILFGSHPRRVSIDDSL